ncbi:hypothetical protein [Paenibacillus lemnae]|uniref:DUF3450 domain-containing protein n=1 Tax=Paenibacillus lemnae TaxID=1330551 RepID=A0A848M4R0_PAELE|nr:hypothetical protein [Paenibacillus lemnae]NMO95221.1 hypothetical protein [Paenibacillus lemnae]
MDKPHSYRMKAIVPLLLAAGFLFQYGERTVHANIFNDAYQNFQQFSELPQEINELKNNYERTLQELDKARADAELYRQQSAELANQNKQLTEMVLQLQQSEAARQQAEEARKRSADRIKTAAITAAGLLAGYFILTRALRYGMRRTNRRI